MECGLQFINYNENQQARVNVDTNITSFRSHYGVGHKYIVAMIKDLPQQDNFVLYDLFLALSFTNNYNTEEIHTTSNWRVCPDKVENCVKRYFKLIQSLKSKKIKISKFKTDTIYVYSVDGVYFHSKESRKTPTRRVYSQKFHGSGLAYEVGIAIFKNHILWSKGLFQASTPDCTIFQIKDSGVFTRIYHKERKE